MELEIIACARDHAGRFVFDPMVIQYSWGFVKATQESCKQLEAADGMRSQQINAQRRLEK